jgi:hypothetical protein
MADEWLVWMKTVHIPEVMATGCFTSNTILKLLTQAQDDDGVNYAIQYTANSMDDYERYQSDFGPGLRQKTMEKYGDKIVAFRSILEVVSNDAGA